jgi:hypothetical protein
MKNKHKKKLSKLSQDIKQAHKEYKEGKCRTLEQVKKAILKKVGRKTIKLNKSRPDNGG